MIHFEVCKAEGRIRGFCLTGHAGYAEEGSDIVCSAVSVLAINTVNALEQLTDEPFDGEEDPDGGYLQVTFPGVPGHDAGLLLDALELGMRSLAENYPQYIAYHSIEEDTQDTETRSGGV